MNQHANRRSKTTSPTSRSSTSWPAISPTEQSDPCKSPEADGNHFDHLRSREQLNTNTPTFFTCPVELTGDFGLEVDVTFEKGLYGDGSIWAENISVHGGITLNFSDLGRTSLLSAAGDIKLTG